MVKPWETKEWKDKRAALVAGKSCAWCGSTEVLHIHHNKQFHINQAIYNEAKTKVVRKIINKAIKKGELKGSILSKRRVVSKKFRNSHTDSEIQIEYQKYREANKAAYKDFCLQHGNEIDNEMKIKFPNISKPDYMNLDKDTVILCRRCHYAIEHGMKICQSCKKNYIKGGYSLCIKCVERIKTCEKFHQRKCADCFNIIGNCYYIKYALSLTVFWSQIHKKWICREDLRVLQELYTRLHVSHYQEFNTCRSPNCAIINDDKDDPGNNHAPC